MKVKNQRGDFLSMKWRFSVYDRFMKGASYGDLSRVEKCSMSTIGRAVTAAKSAIGTPGYTSYLNSGSDCDMYKKKTPLCAAKKKAPKQRTKLSIEWKRKVFNKYCAGGRELTQAKLAHEEKCKPNQIASAIRWCRQHLYDDYFPEIQCAQAKLKVKEKIEQLTSQQLIDDLISSVSELNEVNEYLEDENAEFQEIKGRLAETNNEKEELIKTIQKTVNRLLDTLV